MLLVPDVQLAIVNYLKLCWKQRRAPMDNFATQYQGFLNQDPPLDDKAVLDWLGDVERYGVNVPNFQSLCDDHDRKWETYVRDNQNDPSIVARLLGHKVSSAFLNHREVASAIRYLNYAHHLQKPQIFEALDIQSARKP